MTPVVEVKIADAKEVRAAIETLARAKDNAYNERDRCVAALVRLALKLGYVVGLAQHDASDTNWDADWRTIVFIEFPTGQASWHIHDSEVALFVGVPTYAGTWDGHTTAEKYERLERLAEAA